VPARLINIKYITIRAEKVASPVTALHTGITMALCLLTDQSRPRLHCTRDK